MSDEITVTADEGTTVNIETPDTTETVTEETAAEETEVEEWQNQLLEVVSSVQSVLSEVRMELQQSRQQNETIVAQLLEANSKLTGQITEGQSETLAALALLTPPASPMVDVISSPPSESEVAPEVVETEVAAAVPEEIPVPSEPPRRKRRTL